MIVQKMLWAAMTFLVYMFLLGIILSLTNIVVSDATLIPPIIHQVWIGKRNRPIELMNRCRDLHPNWTYILWTESNLPILRNKDVYACSSLNGKSDIIRYEVLSIFGGFYIDADVYCIKPLDDLRTIPFVAEYQHFRNPAMKGTFRYDDKFVNGAVLGSIPRHTVIEEIIKNIANNAALCKQAAWKAIGPALITKILKHHPSITPMPFSAFSPYHFTQHIDTELSKAREYGSYAVNLWGTTLGWATDRINVRGSRSKQTVARMPTANICRAFRNLWTPELWRTSVAMLKYVHSTFSKHSIEYVLAFGTALGYERYGAFIPWDDDMDIVIRSTDIHRAQNTITTPYCSCAFWGGFKIFRCNSPRAGSYPWRYPFVDVFHAKMKRKIASTIPDHVMFPSKLARFAHITVNIPYNLKMHLRSKYTDVNACKAPHWNHSHEVTPRHGVSSELIPCKTVMQKCAFVMDTYLPLLSMSTTIL